MEVFLKNMVNVCSIIDDDVVGVVDEVALEADGDGDFFHCQREVIASAGGCI